jgi:hypothetical protein
LQTDSIDQLPHGLKNKQIEHKASIVAPIIAVSGLALLIVYLVGLVRVADETVNKRNNSELAQEDIWGEKSIKEREAYYKSQQTEREEYWQKQKEKENIPQQTASTSQNKDTDIAAIMVSVSCAGNKGLIPRSQMGSMMKKMFQDKGIDPTGVYGNWDYYWGIAKEMDAVNKTYCLK